jgi:hypothetical protein
MDTETTGPSQIFEKWGDAARAGFQAVPDVLLKYQGKLGLNSTELVVLLNVLQHWWYAERKPFPRPTTIARRMGSTVRTVQRALQNLEKKGMLVKVQQGADTRDAFDPQPLVERLSALAKHDPDYWHRVEKPKLERLRGVAQQDRASGKAN